MTAKCAHCNGGLGLFISRKGRLRFCSKAHKKAYEHKQREAREQIAVKLKRWHAYLFELP